MRISFHGAAREVTGSNILVECAGKKILLDCGLFQGYKLSEERNYAPFAYETKTIDALIVGHAHLDHTGRIPKLVKEGFRGKIFSTAPTRELARIVLDDSEKLMSEEAKRDKHEPLYTPADVERAMELFEELGYHQTREILPDIKITLKNAGHILGSALTVLETEGKKLVYTSDIGNNPSALLDPPEEITEADIAICESTYGDRVHEDVNKRMEKLSQVLQTTIAANGILMIPTFSVERTQELLHDIEHFCVNEKCDKPTFYLDSPLAIKATEIFKKYPTYLSRKLQKTHIDKDFFGKEHVRISNTVIESKAIYEAANPKVIIAGSGMMNGGRILHHLKNYIGHSNSLLLIVGYQARGTLGRKIFDGAHEIKIFGKNHKVNAKVKAIGSYSAHADGPQLVDWLSKINNLKKLFIVHGENDQSLALAGKFKDKINIDAVVPQQNESYEV